MDDIAKMKAAAEKLATLVEPEADIPGQTMTDCMLASIAISMNQLLSGRVPTLWRDTSKTAVAAKILKRNQNGIGETDILYDIKDAPIVLTPNTLKPLIELFSSDIVLHPLLGSDRSRKEFGSVEGEILQVGTHYGEPALRFKERKSKVTVWCKVSKALQAQIAQQADFADVWNHRRVVVRGTLEYGSDGALTRVNAEHIDRVNPKPVSSSELRDPHFTSGLSIASYLERFREGELG